jgi:putative ABC transport system permease protein
MKLDFREIFNLSRNIRSWSTSSVENSINTVVVNGLKSIPFVDEVIPAYQSQVEVESAGETKLYSVLAMDSTRLNVIAPTLIFIGGSSVRQNDPSSILVAEDVANPPGEDTSFISLGQSVKVRYSFVDPLTGKSEEETKDFSQWNNGNLLAIPLSMRR